MLAQQRRAFVHHGILDFLAPRLIQTSNHKYLTFTRSLSAAVTPKTRNSTNVSPDARSVLKDIRLNVLLNDLDHSELESIETHLSSFKRSVQGNDVQGAWRHYCGLAKRSVSVLGPPQLESLERLVEKACKGSVPRFKEPWTENQVNMLESLALASASGGYRQGLWALMLHFISKGQPQAALQLYQEDMDRNQRVQGTLTGSSAESESQKRTSLHTTIESSSSSNMSGESMLDYDLPMETDQTHPLEQGGRIDTLLLAIAAHAKLDSFHGALQCLLDQPSLRLFPRSIAKLMKALQPDNALQEVVRQYLSTLSAVRHVRFPQGLDAHVANLTRDKADQSLQSICDSILQGFTGSYKWLAPREDLVTKDQPLFLPERHWAKFLAGFIACGREDLARELWNQLIASSVKPVAGLWNGLFEGYRQAGSLERLLNSWEAMKASGIEPDAYSHCAKVAALFEQRRKDLALAAFAAYQHTTVPAHRSVAVYNVVLLGLLNDRDPVSAANIWQDMVTNGPSPDIVSYNTFLRFHGRRGDIKALGETLIDLSKSGLKPDAVTFTSAFSAMLKAGKVNAATRLRALMKSMGIEENTVTYSAIIHDLLKKSDVVNFRAAWSLLSEMEQIPGAEPNEITYTTILTAINKNQALKEQEAMVLAKELLERMTVRGVRPNRVIYHVLLTVCLKNRTPEGLHSALGYYQTMKQKRIPFAHDTWFIILQGLVGRDEWDLAAGLVDEMLKTGFRPIYGVWDMVCKIRDRTKNR